MATKNFSINLKVKQDIGISDASRSHYSNLNLNESHQCAFSGPSKSSLTGKRKVSDQVDCSLNLKPPDFGNCENSQAKKVSNSWNKSTKDLSSNIVNKKSEEKSDANANNCNNSNSTLSLHIKAYEISIQTLSDFLYESKENKLIKTRKNVEQIFRASTCVFQNPFEFPRQQKNYEAKMPEIAQYRESQHLLNPNQKHQANNQQPSKASLQIMSTAFEEMGVLSELGEAVAELGWELPTDIQQEGIPAILGGADVCMAAETGSGKTGAFCLPIVQIVWETMRDAKMGKKKPAKLIEDEWNLNVFDRDPSLGVDRSNFTCESTHPKAWSGGRATKGVHGKGKYYYEATIRKDGLCRIGWATIDSDYDLGKDDKGFGYGGTGKKANGNNFDDYGESFTQNDVIGCFIDFDNGAIHYSKNGKEFPIAFKISKKLINSSFYPAVVCKGSSLGMNFGGKPFAFPPQNGFIGVSNAPSECVEDSPRQGFAQGAVAENRPANAPLCIILEPTKELAEQTHDQINLFAKKLSSPKIRTALVTGGIPINEQMYVINEGIDIISCTPGRVFDLIAQEKIQLNHVRFLVLDEADSLVSPPQDYTYKINQLYQKIPRFSYDGSVLQIIVCSATLHNLGVQRFADSTMHFPQWVDLKGQDVAPDTVHQVVCMVDPIADKSWIRIRSKRGSSIQTDGIHANDKIFPGSEEQDTLSEGVKVLKGEYVVKAIRQFDMDQCIIFCRTKLDCDNLEAYLRSQQKDWTCACLHSDRSPEERTANLNKFKEGEVRFLICTDVAARGIDVRGIPYVINMTLPPTEDKAGYVHRIGRVGRAERMGLALSFVSTVPEKVWYHQCRQRTCNDTRRCAIWYDEIGSLAEIEDHLGFTANRVTTEFDVPVDEYEGKVVYGQKRTEKEIQFEIGHSAIKLTGHVNELNKLERQVQLSYLKLLS